MSQFLLSICIPTYNRSKRLDLLLQSLAAQIEHGRLETQVEIVISDNDSSDRTREVGEKWEATQSFIRYFRNEWNVGGDSNQVRATERGTGKFAWVLGDDDTVRPGALSKILDHLKPGTTQLFLNFRCVTVTGECLAESRLGPHIPDDITTTELIKRTGLFSVYALISSHVFERETFLAAKPRDWLKISPWYIIAITLIAAFSDQKCVLVREPLLDYTAENDRLPDEIAEYLRVMGVLHSLDHLESLGKINGDFLFSCYETGAGNSITLRHPHYFREELYDSLVKIMGYWALPGRIDWACSRKFVERGPGFWDLRNLLRTFYIEDYDSYTNRRKPVIHYWRGKASSPGFSVLLSSDVARECRDFDALMARWPEKFAHESILITRLPEDQVSFQHLNVLMAPFKHHRSPCASLNSGYRKAQAPRVLVVDEVSSPAMPGVIDKIDEWYVMDDVPNSCLLFASISTETGAPQELLGLYVHRRELIHIGGFENGFESWSRRQLLADAAFRLGSVAWAVQGGKISAKALRAWFAVELVPWLRLARTFRKWPFSEHGLNITYRRHLKWLETES